MRCARSVLEYNLLGRVAAVTDLLGAKITYTWDAFFTNGSFGGAIRDPGASVAAPGYKGGSGDSKSFNLNDSDGAGICRKAVVQ